MVSKLAEFAGVFKKAIQEAKDVAILSHMSPDGDNLGSLEALYGYLKGIKKDVTYLGNDDVPEDFAFLPSTNKRVDVDQVHRDFDLMIALDAADEGRFGDKATSLFSRAKKTINIDHHMSNTEYADLNYVISDATSTGEVLFDVLEAIEADFTPEMATGLYTAISTDTGSFQYDSVNGKTHLTIAKLYAYGCDHNVVVQSVYQSRSREKVALMGRVLSNIDFLAGGKVAMAICRLEDRKATGAKSEDTEGIVEQVRNIKGVEMAIFLKEKEEEVKLSFRSKSYLNCTTFASAFGGGGHVRAAGAAMKAPIDEVVAKVKDVLDEHAEEIHA